MLQQIKILNITLLDNDIEADVLFEINGDSLSAFCHPCYFKMHDVIEVNFSFLEDEVAEVIFWNHNLLKEKKMLQDSKNNWRYYCYGQIVSNNPTIIDIGNMLIEYDYLSPSNEIIGDFVYFVISRLDIKYP